MAVEDRDALRTSLAERTRPTGDLWIRFGMTVRQGGDRVAPSFTAIAMFRPPDSVLLGVSRIGIGRVMTLLVEDGVVQLYMDRERELLVGTMDELAEKTALLGGLEPRDLVMGVTVLRELHDALGDERPVAVRPRGDHWLVGSRRDDGRQLLWLVRRTDGLVEELLLRSPEGSEEIRVRYLEYDLVEQAGAARALPYPVEMVYTSVQEAVTIEAEVKEYRLDPDLPAFRLPQAKAVYRLRDVTFEEEP